MNTQNITISLDDTILQKATAIAQQRGITLSELVSDVLTKLVADDEAYVLAKNSALEMLQHGFLLGTTGQISWTRDEIHDRSL